MLILEILNKISSVELRWTKQIYCHRGLLNVLIQEKNTQAFIHGLVSCKNEKDQIKNEGASVFTTLYMDFSDAKGQLTL